MANIKISDLPAATVLTGGEMLPVVQGGRTRRLPLNVALSETASATVEDQGNTINAGASAIRAFYLGLGTSYMPSPSGDPLSDASRLSVQQARGTRFLELQDGAYLLPAAGAVHRDGQALYGHGRKTTIRATAPGTMATTGCFYSAFERSDVEINGVVFDYAGFREPAVGYAALGFRTADKLRLRDVEVRGWPRFGLAINRGSDILCEDLRLIRAANPLDQSGAPIAAGQAAQALQVSHANAAPLSKAHFRRIYCEGAAINTTGAYLVFEHVEVNGFTFGFGIVTEQDPLCHHVEILDAWCHGGRGVDVNATYAGGFEIWGAAHTLVRCRSSDNDGYGLTLGARTSKVALCRWDDIGRVTTAAGVGLPHVAGGAYTAAGSQLIGNTYRKPTGASSWGAAPLVFSTLDPVLAVQLDGEDFDDYAHTSFPPTTRWGSPGARIRATTGGFSGQALAIAFTDAFLPGADRSRHVVVGCTFRGNDGSNLPDGECLSADVRTNSVSFIVDQIARTGTTSLPAGAVTGRLISID